MIGRLLLASLASLLLVLAACGGGGGGPAASPTPAVSVPTPPAEFTAYPDAIAAYLTEAQGSSSCLAELFAAWDIPEPTVGRPCAAADLDGDGRDEYVVRIADAATTGPPLSETPAATPEPASYGGDVIILDDSDGGYEVVYRATVRDGETVPPERFLDPTILGVQDYNGDGKAEAVFTGSECGASTCTTSVFVVGWDGSQYVDLFAEPVAVLSTKPSEIEFEDEDRDGAQEIRIPAGNVASVGAGPQRNSILTYAWDGTHYALASTEYAQSDYLYFVVLDADQAFIDGKAALTSSLYSRAAEDTDLKDWKAEIGTGTDRAELVPYAQFRLYLTQLSLLNPTDVASAESLVGSISGLAYQYPDSLHGQAAQHFAEAYRQEATGTPNDAYTAGCNAFVAFLEEHRSEFDAIWDYGYANPKREPDQLCPR
jgi:hypothetical protein